MTLGLSSTGLLSSDEHSPYIRVRDTLLFTVSFLKRTLPTLTVQIIERLITFAQKINFLPQIFHICYATATLTLGLSVSVVRHVLRAAGYVIWLICEPFSLAIHIVEYNAHAFINIWLRLLFNTKLENLMRLEYGMSQLKIIAQWIRFINVMCITGIVLGITTYYSVIRMIYWLTKLERQHKQKQKTLKQELKETYDLKKRSDLVAEFESLRTPPPVSALRHTVIKTEQPSLLEDFIQQERNTLRSESQNTLTIQEGTPPLTSGTSPGSTLNEDSLNQLRYEHILHNEQDDDDVYNYESLTSLASGSSTSVSSPLQQKEDSPVTQAFRSRLSSLNSNGSEDSTPYTTIGSSVFSSTRGNGAGLPPMTPITTIEEDEDEEEYKL